MGSVKLLTNVESGQIEVLKADGLSNRQVSIIIGRHKIVVNNYIRLGSDSGTK